MSISLKIPCDLITIHPSLVSAGHSKFVTGINLTPNSGLYAIPLSTAGITWTDYPTDTFLGLEGVVVLDQSLGAGLYIIQSIIDPMAFGIHIFHQARIPFEYMYVGVDILVAPFVNPAVHPAGDTLQLRYLNRFPGGTAVTQNFTRAQLADLNYIIPWRIPMNPKTLNPDVFANGNETFFYVKHGGAAPTITSGKWIIKSIQTYLFIQVAKIDFPKLWPHISLIAKELFPNSNIYTDLTNSTPLRSVISTSKATLESGATVWNYDELVFPPSDFLLLDPIPWYTKVTEFKYYQGVSFISGSGFSQFPVGTLRADPISLAPNRTELISEQLALYPNNKTFLHINYAPASLVTHNALYNSAPNTGVLLSQVKPYAQTHTASNQSWRVAYTWNAVLRYPKIKNVPSGFHMLTGINVGAKPDITRSRSARRAAAGPLTLWSTGLAGNPVDLATLNRDDDIFYLEDRSPNVNPDSEFYMNDLYVSVFIYEN